MSLGLVKLMHTAEIVRYSNAMCVLQVVLTAYLSLSQLNCLFEWYMRRLMYKILQNTVDLERYI